MDIGSRQSLGSKANVLKNYDNTAVTKPADKKPASSKPDMGNIGKKTTAGRNSGNKEVNTAGSQPISRSNAVFQEESPISQDKLREAVIWSEILGKPVCKRGKRR